MKNRYIIMAAAAFACLVGCAKLDSDFTEQGKTCDVILEGEIQTKTSFGKEGDGALNVVWKKGDMLGLFVSQDGAAVTSAQNRLSRLTTSYGTGIGSTRGLFSTSLTLTESSSYDIAIYYPYNSRTTSSSALAHSIPTIQTQPGATDSGHLGMSGCFAYTKAVLNTPESLEYTPIPHVDFVLDYKTSAACFKLTAASADLAGWKVKSVSVIAPEGSYLAGDVVYTPENDSFELTGNKSERVSLNVSGGAALSTDKAVNLYMVVFPAALAGKSIDIRYTLESADASQTKVVTHTKTFGSGSEAFSKGCIHRFTEAIPAADAEGWVYAATDAAVDLSANGTSNCYIVSTPGTYSFDATVIGNGQKGIMLPTSKTFFHTESATIAPTQASLVWQTEKGLITSVDLTDGKVVFTKSSSVEYGNALIAVKDASGNILWSWHIWCTDTGEHDTFVSATGTYESMDRNLGATHASRVLVSDETLRTRTLGLFYQWGRKDPIVGPAVLNTSNTECGSPVAKYGTPLATLYDINNAEVTRPGNVKPAQAKVGDAVKSIEYSILHPNTFITGDDQTQSDWFSTKGAGKGPSYRPYYLWGNPTGYNYKLPTKPSPVKTIYDPCPVGYMIPPADFYGALKVTDKGYWGFLMTTGDDGNKKTLFPLCAAIACKSGNAGKWIGGGDGYMQQSSFNSADGYRAWNFYMLPGGTINAANSLFNSYGFNVRCIQEIN